MSAFVEKADIISEIEDVCFVPEADNADELLVVSGNHANLPTALFQNNVVGRREVHG